MLVLYANHNGYYYDCKFSDVTRVIKGNEDEVFKSIFIRIDDCPEWSRPILWENRKSQLEEEQRLEDKIKDNLIKKQKRLEFVIRVLPVLNK